jgi:abortive infection bacteriophage resistance protein
MGYFFIMKYTDPAISVSDQLDILRRQGLLISDISRAEKYLTFVGFHRLMKYSFPFMEGEVRHYKKGITFDAILELYIFDRKLRLLVLDATERVEVAFRSVISNEMSIVHGPHWYMKERHFRNQDNSSILRDVANATNFFSKKRQDGACKKYYSTYSIPPLPTSWIATESLTFGKWSRVYESIVDQSVKDAIASKFSLTQNLFTSWMKSLAVTRNYCAHHRRYWNRNHIVCMPKIPQVFRTEIPPATLSKTYSRLAILRQTLKQIINSDSFTQNLSSLLTTCPVPSGISIMGFPEGWESFSLWN